MLTAEQQKLAADNHNLIYQVLHDHNLPIDDYYDVAAIGLCKAAAKFDPSRGYAFSTYAYPSMLKAIWMDKRNGNAKKRSKYLTVSLSEPIHENLTYGDAIQSDKPTPEELVLCQDILDQIQKLKPQERVVIELTLQGLTQEEIAAIVGYSQVTVSRRISKAKQKLSA